MPEEQDTPIEMAPPEDELPMQQSAAGRVNAQRIQAQQSALGIAEATQLQTEQSAVGLATAMRADMNDSAAGAIVSEAVVAQDARAGVVVARDVRSNSVRSGVLIAGKVDGPVHTVLDTAGAVVAGLAARLNASPRWLTVLPSVIVMDSGPGVVNGLKYTSSSASSEATTS